MSSTHGRTKLGHIVHVKATDHLPTGTRYARFNKKVAVFVTEKVGTMTCAYVFSLLALFSLPAILSAFKVFHSTFPAWLIKASIVSLVAWVAQTYIQLVLLSVIMVGQNIASAASDARAALEFEHTEFIKDAVDLETAGGVRAVLDAVEALSEKLPGRKASSTK